jgi:hypothetical protein
MFFGDVLLLQWPYMKEDGVCAATYSNALIAPVYDTLQSSCTMHYAMLHYLYQQVIVLSYRLHCSTLCWQI